VTPVEVVMSGVAALAGFAALVGGLFVTRREWEQYRESEAANRAEIMESLRELRDWTRGRDTV
jgi:glutamate dehydrogenase/leucine dehydrogenase